MLLLLVGAACVCDRRERAEYSRADGIAECWSEHGEQWYRLNIELVFDQCDELHGLGGLVGERSDERQCEHGGADEQPDLHAHLHRSWGECKPVGDGECLLRDGGGLFVQQYQRRADAAGEARGPQRRHLTVAGVLRRHRYDR